MLALGPDGSGLEVAVSTPGTQSERGAHRAPVAYVKSLALAQHRQYRAYAEVLLSMIVELSQDFSLPSPSPSRSGKYDA